MKMNDSFGGGDLSESKISGIISSLDGQELEVKGYIIPLSGQMAQSNFMFSAFPYSMCFFCGKASPASVLSLYLTKTRRYKMDDFLAFRGILELNVDDPNEYYYILREAREAY